jgi:hypothetical protein
VAILSWLCEEGAGKVWHKNAKPVSTPLANHFRLSTSQCPKIVEETEDMSKVPYASAVQAAAKAAKEALWLTGLVRELGIQQGGVPLYCDS